MYFPKNFRVNTRPDDAEKLAFECSPWDELMVLSDGKSHIVMEVETRNFFQTEAESPEAAVKAYIDYIDGDTTVYIYDEEEDGWIDTDEKVPTSSLMELEEIRCEWDMEHGKLW